MTQVEKADAGIPLPIVEEQRRGPSSATILAVFVMIAFIGWLFSGIYKVGQGEVVIVERLGQYLSNQEGKTLLVEQGLHYGFPWPVDRIHKINLSINKTFDIDTFNVSPDALNALKQRKMQEQPDVGREYWDALYDPYLITADKNMLHVKIAVNYHIRDPEAYLAAVAPDADKNNEDEKRQELLQKLAEYVLTRSVARVTVDDALGKQVQDDQSGTAGGGTDGTRNMLQDLVLTPMNAAYQYTGANPGETCNFGIQVVKVDVTTITPPSAVKQAFDELIRARANASVAVLNAQATENDYMNRAKATAATTKVQADAYRSGQVQKAQGDVDRFNQVYAKYQLDPQTTKFNLYTDCVNAILNSNNRPFYVMKGQKIVLPISAPEERIKPDVSGAGGQTENSTGGR